MVKEVPVFVINGFIESGKTTLIKEIIENNDNFRGNSTVVITTEEGEIEYDDKWQEKFETQVEVIDDESEFTAKKLEAIDKHYMADRYVIEFNSFFDYDKWELPKYMVVYQTITLVDASKFNVMFNNMRKIFSNIFRPADLIIFNRCDGIKDLANFRRQARAINQQAQIAFENADGTLSTMLDEDLPYDLSKNEILFEEDVYPVWYTEVFDKYEKYFNKTFKFKTFVRSVINENSFVIGRDVMVCCQNDIQFLGYEVINDTNVKVKEGNCIYLECEVTHEHSNIVDEDVVMLHAKGITILKDEENKVLNM